MRFLTLLSVFITIFIQPAFAEGTREMAPNGAIVVNGNNTTDIAALHINHFAYNSFASYTNPDPHSRLYIHLINPVTECIFVGFSFGHPNETSPFPAHISYEYRIKDPNGNVVFGPVTVNPGDENIQSWSEGFTGPIQLHGAGGYDAIHVTSSDLTSQGWSGEGDYYIEFRNQFNSDFLIDFWDITVADCAGIPPLEKKGRVWSYNWSFFAINDFGFPNRPFNGAFYVCAPDPTDDDAAFITKIDFNGAGFRPAAFNVAFNSFGIRNTGNVIDDRKSIPDTNATQSEYSIFLNDPVEICKTAVVGEITLVGISRCNAEMYCIQFSTTKEGQIELLLDFDGPDSIYTPGTTDVIITHVVNADEVGKATCIDWNGQDGFHNPVFEGAATQIPVIISYAQGIYHFPIYDAEFMTNGFTVEAIRPPASIPLLHYDDSNIPIASGSGEPKVQLTGCTSPCHRWTNYNPGTNIGYGNLNTINSWWFSQRIIREEVFILPSYYNCLIDGPASLCQGGTTSLSSAPQVIPFGATGNEIISTTWTGPGIIGSNTGTSITVDSDGIYSSTVRWLTSLGDTCETSCDFTLTLDPPLESSIDTLILLGDSLKINGETYFEAGQYIQQLTSVFGCDSILTINVKVLQTVIHYNLNACLAHTDDGTNMDYSEFTPVYPEPLSCAAVTGTFIFRDPPQSNKHSCTPGVNNSIAMCISALDGCTYVPGDQASVVFEVTIVPAPDTAAQLTGLTFFEKAPDTYNWISGSTGPNNYPTLFGIRVLKNGVEIFRREDIPTTSDWTEEIFDFTNDILFIVNEPAVFRFELLPYCLVGNGAAVAAWDMDEINVSASCVPFNFTPVIDGTVSTESGRRIKNVEIQLSKDPLFPEHEVSLTDQFGQYKFEGNEYGSAYYLRGYKNTGFKNGVSTLDLIQIQKHLLGFKRFESPYQMIAADANRSNTVSVLDLLELRKLILSIYSELPNNNSWRFGTARTELEGQYPWGFSETIHIEALENDIHKADFVGVKIGDVNGDATTNQLDGGLVPRNNSTVQLLIQEQTVQTGSPVQIDITSRNFSDVVGLQFGLSLDHMVLHDVISGKLLIETENFNLTPDGLLLISWNQTDPINVEADEVLFSLILMPNKSGNLSDLLSLNSSVLQAEAYQGEDADLIDVELRVFKPEHQPGRNILFQNQPNPFSTVTMIRFELEKPGPASISLYDLSGRLLKVIDGQYESGLNELEISCEELNIDGGVILCQLQSDGYISVQKMVILRKT